MGALTGRPGDAASRPGGRQLSPVVAAAAAAVAAAALRSARHAARRLGRATRRLRRFAVIVALGLAIVPCARGQDIGRWQPLIAEASMRFDVPAAWIEEVMRAESGGKAAVDGRPIRSTKGAIGLMQLMPGTWTELRGRLQLGDDPDEPRDNILAGTFYLRLLYDRYGFPGLFAAYNAGPGRYERFLAGGTLPAETRTYLARVTPAYRTERRWLAQFSCRTITPRGDPRGERRVAAGRAGDPGGIGGGIDIGIGGGIGGPGEAPGRWRGEPPRTGAGDVASVFAVRTAGPAATDPQETGDHGGEPGTKPDPLFAIRHQRGSDAAP